MSVTGLFMDCTSTIGAAHAILSPLSMLAISAQPVELQVAPGRSAIRGRGSDAVSRSAPPARRPPGRSCATGRRRCPTIGWRIWSSMRRAALRAPCRCGSTEHSVSYGHWTFLRILWETEGLTQRQLSAQAGVMEPTTFSALNAMERRGYVVRRPSPRNRKEIHVYLTPQGTGLEGQARSVGRRGERGRLARCRSSRHRRDAPDAAGARREPGGRRDAHRLRAAGACRRPANCRACSTLPVRWFENRHRVDGRAPVDKRRCA